MSEIEETVLDPVKENNDIVSQENVNIILETGIIHQDIIPSREQIIETKKRYVLGFAFSPDKQSVLLITKNRPDWQAGLFNGLGGKVEETDSTIHYAMEREFLEEAGILIPAQQWHLFNISGNAHFELNVFWATSPYLEEHISMTDELVSLENIEHLYKTQFAGCVSNLSWLISMALDKDINHILSHVTYKN